jgi:hypothetical protein
VIFRRRRRVQICLLDQFGEPLTEWRPIDGVRTNLNQVRFSRVKESAIATSWRAHYPDGRWSRPMRLSEPLALRRNERPVIEPLTVSLDG